MSEQESEDTLIWEDQKQMNIWDEKRRHKMTLEELFDGNARYMKFIASRLGSEGVKEGFQATVDFTFEKNMGGLRKMGATFLKAVSKKLLLKKVVIGYYVNMQHVVDLKCIRKMEFNPDSAEIIIEKCTAKTAWKMGLKNNQATDIFEPEDYCEQSCIASFKKFLDVPNATVTTEFQKRGCRQIIKLVT